MNKSVKSKCDEEEPVPEPQTRGQFSGNGFTERTRACPQPGGPFWREAAKRPSDPSEGPPSLGVVAAHSQLLLEPGGEGCSAGPSLPTEHRHRTALGRDTWPCPRFADREGEKVKASGGGGRSLLERAGPSLVATPTASPWKPGSTPPLKLTYFAPVSLRTFRRGPRLRAGT